MEQFNFERPKATFDAAFTEINIAEWLETETIDTVVYTAVDSAGDPATTEVLDTGLSSFQGPVLYPWIKGGVDGEKYTVICQVDTEEGSQQEYRVVFSIREAP